MSDCFLELKAALHASFTTQTAATTAWHESEPMEPGVSQEPTTSNLSNLILAQHIKNFLLWHVEDKARRKDVPDSEIANCKREVDALNQARNDLIEKVDSCIVAFILSALPQKAAMRHNTETLGMAIDRLSILALKIFHMDEQTKRTDVSQEHIISCKSKLEVLQKQRCDLIVSVMELVDDYAIGAKRPLLYHQFKMYNDPSLNPELYTRR